MKKLFKLLVAIVEFIAGGTIIYAVGYVVYAINKAQIHKWIRDVQYCIVHNGLEMSIAVLCAGIVLVLNYTFMKISARNRRQQKREDAIAYFKKRLVKQRREKAANSKAVEGPLRDPNGWRRFIDATTKEKDGWSQFIDAGKTSFL